MEITKSELKVKVFGNDYSLKKPTARKAAELKKELEGEKDEVQMVELTCKFLNDCGLPEEATKELEIEHLHALIEAISSKKK